MADFLALNTKYRKKTRRRSDEESPTTLTLSVRSTPQTDFSSWSLWIALYWCKISILFDNSSSYHLHLKIKPKIFMHCIPNYTFLSILHFYIAATFRTRKLYIIWNFIYSLQLNKAVHLCIFHDINFFNTTTNFQKSKICS